MFPDWPVSLCIYCPRHLLLFIYGFLESSPFGSESQYFNPLLVITSPGKMHSLGFYALIFFFLTAVLIWMKSWTVNLNLNSLFTDKNFLCITNQIYHRYNPLDCTGIVLSWLHPGTSSGSWKNKTCHHLTWIICTMIIGYLTPRKRK